jgi:hypothetical protein
VEDLAIEQFVGRRVSKLSMKLFWTASFDVGRACAHGCDLLLHGFGDELEAVVGADVPGHAERDEQVREGVNDVEGLEPADTRMARNSSMMLSMRILRLLWVRSSTKSGPDMIAVLGPEPDAGAVVQPQAAPLRLPCGNLQPLSSPDVVDCFCAPVLPKAPTTFFG